MDFKIIAHFNSRLEAETIGHALDQHNIPFLVQSTDIGIFGPGHMGNTTAGADLCVPEDRIDEVTRLLDCVVKSPADEDKDDEGASS